MAGLERLRPSSSRERLAEISHHFLSAATGSRLSVVLPVALLPGVVPFPVYALCQAFRARGRRCEVLNLDSDAEPAVSASRRDDILAGRLDLVFGKDVPDVCLVPINRAVRRVAPGGELLLPVTAELDGVRAAYCWVKQCVTAARPGHLNLVMVEAQSSRQAMQCAEKLKEAGRHFLGIEMSYAGCLLARNADTDGMEGQRSTMGLGSVADRLIERWGRRRVEMTAGEGRPLRGG